MKALLLLFLAHPCQREVEDAVQENYDKDKNVAIVPSLVDGHYEAKALHYERHDKEASHEHRQGMLP